MWHWSIRCGNNEDSRVHLSRTGDHVFNIVSVTRTIYVCVVTVSSFIFLVRSSDGDSTSFFFRSVINLVISNSFVLTTDRFRKCSSNSCRQGRFTVIHVTNCSNV
ncbi:hypothetical protein LEP1GSC052_2876 [Leptospira kmetyi serovar Malaysia str. Bejo-Iso9]|nr:hypothetical protein LEP1GSC052_2876 [Leptospira kmetyi serovar Malaysia str. Bejo-Iso9]